MTLALTPALGRALALAILLGLLLLVWFAMVSPLIDMATERLSDIETLQERRANLRATIARIPELERRGLAAKAKLDGAGGIWIGAGDAPIAASIQDQLRQAVTNGDGIVKSTSYLGATVDKDLQTIRIRLSAEGTLDTLQQTLAAVEIARPPMFVESLTVAGPAQFTTEKAPILALDFEISALMRKTEQ
jgi:hypothetical protein